MSIKPNKAVSYESSELYKIRHSIAHVLAQAVSEFFAEEEVKFAGGPPIEDGFYYDFHLPRSLVPDDLVWIESRMKEIVRANHPFIYEVVDAEKARGLFREQPFKLELIDGLLRGNMDENGETIDALDAVAISLYRHSNFVDLCRGPHVDSTAAIDPEGFKLMKLAGAYWRGDEKRPMLQRIYGTAWSSKKELEEYLHRIEEAERRDHRKLGKELELFFFHPTAPGMPYWLPNGFIVLNELISWWRQIHGQEGYQEIASPLINSKKLWEISGHWDHYRDDMFVMDMGNDEIYGVKPMNCPNAMIVFNHKQRSYRDLPLRLSDCDILHRHERSGALHGLMRVQKFQQDDAHIFIADDQAGIENEYRRIIQLVDRFYKVFKLDYRFRLATKPKDSIGDSESWYRAECALRSVLQSHAPDGFEIAEGDGAFYGPKIDILIKDAIGRDWQMGTIQLDFQLPRRFECQYIDNQGKKQYPAVIHRVIYGSLERFLGILIEHSAGKLPVWLCPNQVRIIPIASRHDEYAIKIHDHLQSLGIRVDLDADAGSMGDKIRRYRLARIPYAIVVGDKEVASNNLSIRQRDKDELYQLSLEQLSAKILQEITSKEFHHK